MNPHDFRYKVSKTRFKHWIQVVLLILFFLNFELKIPCKQIYSAYYLRDKSHARYILSRTRAS